MQKWGKYKKLMIGSKFASNLECRFLSWLHAFTDIVYCVLVCLFAL